MVKKIHGIAIAPGVSKNGRYYSRELLARTAKQMAARIKDGTHPIVMRTHHEAGDDSLRIVARLSKVSLASDGAIAYEAVPADTQAGRDVLALADDSTKALAHVSVYGKWTGKRRMVTVGDRVAETADDLEVDFIDFTANPGFVGTTAHVSEFVPSDDPNIVSESMRPVLFAEESPFVAETLTDTDLVSVNVCGAAGGFDVSVNAWQVPATQIDAFADTAQRALTAALSIASGGPVDDDSDAAGETAPEGDVAETHETTDTDAVTETGKESRMSDNTETVAETVETEEKPVVESVTLADVAAVVAEAFKQAGITPVAETAPEAEKPVSEAVNPEQSNVDLTVFRSQIVSETVAELVRSGAVRPQRKGYRVTETAAADESSWDTRGIDFAKAMGLVPEDADAETPVGA